MIQMWTAMLGWPGLGLARLARLAALPGLGWNPNAATLFAKGEVEVGH